MATHKPTSDPKQLWTFLGLLALVAGIFGYAVLPFLDPGRAPSTGAVAPDFTLGLLGKEGETGRVQLSDYRGHPVVLDFWASWCAPCRAQAPILDRVSKQMESAGVRLIGVNTGDQVGAARAFIESAALSYPSVVDGHPPKVIWLRLGNRSTNEVRSLIQRRLDPIAVFESDKDAAFLSLA
jgi:thiol-disulfide isomerase/thioredoxin